MIKELNQRSGGLHLFLSTTYPFCLVTMPLSFSERCSQTELAKNFSCARTKTTAIVKKALAPHFTQRVIESITMSTSAPFSLMMDESNDKTDKSCIILLRLLDPQLGEVKIFRHAYCEHWYSYQLV